MDIMNKVSNCMKRNKILHCILKIVKNRENTKFLDSVLSSELPSSDLMLDKDFLILRREKCYYIIDMQEAEVKDRGFCAILRNILAGIEVADTIGMEPVVNVEDSFYNVSGGYQGISNMYEYYFEPEIKYTDVNREKENCIRFRMRHIDLVYRTFSGETQGMVNGYCANEAYLRDMGRLMRRYVHLKKDIEKQFETSISEMFKDHQRILGVHIRGTDFFAGLQKHPIAAELPQYYECIDIAMERGYNAIFIATDDDMILKECKSRYGDKILSYEDTLRSGNGIAIHMQETKRKDNGYLLGIEVLRDVYTLAACKGLISGLSQVSFCAQIVKYSQKEEFEYTQIIDNGINKQDNSGMLEIYKKKIHEEGLNIKFK